MKMLLSMFSVYIYVYCNILRSLNCKTLNAYQLGVNFPVERLSIRYRIIVLILTLVQVRRRYLAFITFEIEINEAYFIFRI